jgi:riboflavin synthase
MFTGIVEEVGRVCGIRQKPQLMRIDIEADKVVEETKVGDSIAVNGICLTVVQINKKILSFEAIPETTQLTTLKEWRLRQDVNLERALKVGDRLGGHFVTGHVDGVGVVRSKKISKGSLEFQIGVPLEFLKYLIRKGSIAVDGISLTIARVKGGGFSVCIIPHTASATTLGNTHAGQKVNIELDMLAKRSV